MEDFLRFFTNYRGNVGDNKLKSSKKKKEKKPSAKDVNPEVDRGSNGMTLDEFVNNSRRAHDSTLFAQPGEYAPAKGGIVDSAPMAPTELNEVASIRDDFANALGVYASEPNKDSRIKMLGEYQKRFRKAPYVSSYILNNLINTENQGGDPKQAAGTALGTIDAELAKYFRKA